MKLVHLSVVLAAFSSAIAGEADIMEQLTPSLAVVRVDSSLRSEVLEQGESLADRVEKFSTQLYGSGLDQRGLEQMSAKPDFRHYLLADKPGFGNILRSQELDVKTFLDSSLKDQFNLKDELKVDADKFKVDLKPLSVDLKPLSVDLKPLSVDLKPLSVDLKSLMSESPQLQLDPVAFYVRKAQLTLEAPDFGGGHASSAASYYGAPVISINMGAPVFYSPFAGPHIYPPFYFPPMLCGCGFYQPTWRPFPMFVQPVF